MIFQGILLKFKLIYMTFSFGAPTYLQKLQFHHSSPCQLVLAGLATFHFLKYSHCLPVLRPPHMRFFFPGKFFSQIFPWLFSILVYVYAQTHEIVYSEYVQCILYQLYLNIAVKIESILKLPPQTFAHLLLLIFSSEFFFISFSYLFCSYPITQIVIK